MEVEDAKEELVRLQQSLDQLSSQKRQFQTQLMEADSALEAVGEDGEAFRIIGNLMVKQSTGKLREDLVSRKETLSVRLDAVEKQLEKLQSRVKDAQEAVLAGLRKDDKE